MSPSLSRRSFLVGTAASAAASARFGKAIASPPASLTPVPMLANPLVRQRADAQILLHEGAYYLTGSVPEYDRLVLRRSPTLAGLSNAPERVLWRRPAHGKLGGYIWAPEVHKLWGRWYMYFAAGDANDPFHIRTYVLRGPERDPFEGDWSLEGQLQTPWDSFTLDSTSFDHKGQHYLCWAQKEPGIETNSNLYLAPLATPTTLARAPVRLSVPTLPWETQGFKVNEGPAVLARHDRLFLTYSASATDARYCLGMLTASADSDIMAAGSWSKSPVPVFSTCEATGVYGPGHNSFTVDDQGRDVLVYHGRNYREIKGDPLFDPNRHTRVQRIYYRPDGSPDFGVPVGNGPVPDRFSPVDRPGAFLLQQGGHVILGEGPLPLTQLRRRPGLAGADTVSIEPIERRGWLLRAGRNGEVVLARNDGSAAFARQTSFRFLPGLADPTSRSFAGLGGGYLLHRGGRLVLAVPRTAEERAAATFRLS